MHQKQSVAGGEVFLICFLSQKLGWGKGGEGEGVLTNQKGEKQNQGVGAN